MLVLIGVAPAGFVVNMNSSGYDITRTRDAVNHLEQYYQQHASSLEQVIQMSPPALPTPEEQQSGPNDFHCDVARALPALHLTQGLLNNLSSYDGLNVEQRSQLRRLLMCISDTAEKAARLPGTTSDDKRFLTKLKDDLLNTVEYAPVWIIVAVALALSLGTMVGWRRVATTIGEKIGKKGMTYAQGMSAQMTAAVSIGVASYTGMPVSTTHVLSSSVAGTMLVDGGGVQGRTIKNILLAWIFTLPISILLSGVLYWLALKLI
ncbi:Low-affinity inorganic phosphate transporter 1 [Erwinia amylovora MR1]|nr:Low-affinity inorganic phosphate transporter 1 [Erwinia amylovora MR1]